MAESIKCDINTWTPIWLLFGAVPGRVRVCARKIETKTQSLRLNGKLKCRENHKSESFAMTTSPQTSVALRAIRVS